MNSPTNHQHPQFSAPLIPISLQRLLKKIIDYFLIRTSNSIIYFIFQLKREDYSQPWGFRIQGGADYRLYLSVKKVIQNYTSHLVRISFNFFYLFR